MGKKRSIVERLKRIKKNLEYKQKLTLFDVKMLKRTMIISMIISHQPKANNLMAAPPKRQITFPPQKGSFPLDHFKECDEHYKNYMKCRHLTKAYLECRMSNNLMQKEELSKLGFR